MDILKIIFVNSIIYKIFLLLLATYENSYLKIICDYFVHIFKNSYICHMVQKYLDSTPIYKYSFIKKINEMIYYFVVDHSKWIYEFVNKTFINSFVVINLGENYKQMKNDKFKSVCFLSSLFLVGFEIAVVIMYGANLLTSICIILAIILAVLFIISDSLKVIFFNSFSYKTVVKLLEVEVSNEID